MKKFSKNQQQAINTGLSLGKLYLLHNPNNFGNSNNGQYRGKNSGASLDYRDFREYQPGDDLRMIDWSAYARSDLLTVKIYHEEVSPHLDLIIDNSASLAVTKQKEQQFFSIISFLATAATNAGFTITIWKCSAQGMIKHDGEFQDPLAWHGFDCDEDYSLGESWSFAAPIFKPQGIRIVVSDLLFEGETEKIFSGLLNEAGVTAIFQVLAEEDINPPELVYAKIEDSETCEEQELHWSSLAKVKYRNNFDNHLSMWINSARKHGVPFISCHSLNDINNRMLQEMQQYGLVIQK